MMLISNSKYLTHYIINSSLCRIIADFGTFLLTFSYSISYSYPIPLINLIFINIYPPPPINL